MMMAAHRSLFLLWDHPSPSLSTLPLKALVTWYSPGNAMVTLSRSAIICSWSLVALFRVLVAFQFHSGQDGWHGSQSAYGGDFEVQRHWMEITWQLPVGEWYYDEPAYFGLDYPPLTAYISYLCGFLSEKLVGPHSVALLESRGLEDTTHKAFMRATVLVLDLLIYGSGAWWMTRKTAQHDVRSIFAFIFVMVQPALILIDHGHFQYNTTALGLCIWAFFFMTKPGMRNCVIGSVLYCLALSFKQMTLYYAPAVFFYLLGRCKADNGRYFFKRFLTLGVTVMITFSVIFGPVVLNGPAGTSILGRMGQVLRRIFPLHRGMFEGKVSNLWCVMALKPLKIRQRLPEGLQPLAALCLTILLVVPCCIFMFRVGRQGTSVGEQHRTSLLWGVTNSALSFFLASFQVHEKSILLASVPACFLVHNDTRFVSWLSIAAAWSLWPLLQIDRLQVGYLCSMTIYLSLLHLWKNALGDDIPSLGDGLFDMYPLASWLTTCAYLIMTLLHVCEIVFEVPKTLPDLFPVFWSIFGCCFFCLAWLVTCRRFVGRNEPKSKLS